MATDASFKRSGFFLETAWDSGSVSYEVGDKVSYYNLNYICIDEHESGGGKEPDNTDYWNKHGGAAYDNFGTIGTDTAPDGISSNTSNDIVIQYSEMYDSNGNKFPRCDKMIRLWWRPTPPFFYYDADQNIVVLTFSGLRQVDIHGGDNAPNPTQVDVYFRNITNQCSKTALYVSNEHTIPTAADDWVGSTDYFRDDLVSYGGSIYRCEVDHTSDPGVPPPSTVFRIAYGGGYCQLGVYTPMISMCKLSDNGTSCPWQWRKDTGTNIERIKTDYADNIYICGSSVRFQKYTAWGKKLWDYNTGGTFCYGVAIDNYGNCYIAGSRSGSISVWKLDRNGNLLWTYDTGADTYDVATDDTYVYIVGNTSGAKQVWALDLNGNLQWSYNATQPTRAVVADYNGYIYIGSDGGLVRRLSSEGVPSETYDTGEDIYGISYGNGYVAVGGNYGAGLTSGYLLTAHNLNLSRSFDLGSDCYDTAFNPDGDRVYFGCHTVNGDRPLYKYDFSGNEDWAFGYTFDGSSTDAIKSVTVDSQGNVICGGPGKYSTYNGGRDT